MATDGDRYGLRIGKRFERIRARICLPDGDDTSASILGDYIEREFFRDDAGAADLLRRAERVVADHRDGWLLPDHHDLVFRALQRNESRSFAASHIVRAMHDALAMRDPAAVLPACATHMVQWFLGKLRLQPGYRDDAVLNERASHHKQAIVKDVLRRLSVRTGALVLDVVPTASRTPNTADLLTLVIATQ